MLNKISIKRPIDELLSISQRLEINILDESFSKLLDEEFPSFRSKFHYPKIKNLKEVVLERFENRDQDCIYFCGHSLGLQPIETKNEVDSLLTDWANLGVIGHFEGTRAWTTMEDRIKPLMANIVGAKREEIGIMNSLTVNLNFLLISFYQPKGKRTKILLEEKAFPSDHYAIESQIRLHNYEPNEHLIFLKPRKNDTTIRTEDIISLIEREGDNIALVFLSGIQYFTGQLFRIKEITEAAKKKGCIVGFDLAHAVGNVELKLHDWNVDFAVWCSYKYLNSGPGGIGAIFLHEKNFDLECKRLDGWWGHDLKTRFLMNNKIEYTTGASKYANSTVSSVLLSCLYSSLKTFEEANFSFLLKKSVFLTSYLEYLLETRINSKAKFRRFEQITPKEPNERGAHISIKFSKNVSKVYEELEKYGVIVILTNICSKKSKYILKLKVRFPSSRCFKIFTCSIIQYFQRSVHVC